MNGTTTCKSFSDKLREEQLQIMERAYKIEERKILFVIGLLSVGGINVVIGSDHPVIPSEGSTRYFIHIWYLAPFIAVFFDVLALLQKYSVRRIGAFLSHCSDDSIEQSWESFVKEHRDRVLRFQADGFTLLTFLASIWMIFHFIHKDDIEAVIFVEWLWFLLLIGVHISSKIYAFGRFKELDEIKSVECGTASTENTL